MYANIIRCWTYPKRMSEPEIFLDPEALRSVIDMLLDQEEPEDIKDDIEDLKVRLKDYKVSKPKEIKVTLEVFKAELQQVLEAQTMDRMKHYLGVIFRGLEETKFSDINDINLNRWKEHTEIETESLWYWDKRDGTGAHMADYHGNFIPQIPRQAMLRYTKEGDTVLDLFLGSGTTLIECRRLGRNGIGVELQSEIAEASEERINEEPNETNIVTSVVNGDSGCPESREKVEAELKRLKRKNVQLLMMHPPYWNIVKFSEDERDLSNAKNVEEFLDSFGKILDNFADLLEDGRYLAIVIGDIYDSGEWIPLGHMTMVEAAKRGFLLKSTVVKNMEGNRAKRGQENLWRLRALKGGFYVFKHEYVFFLQKNGQKASWI